jgi:transcriptional regulator with XRE-family HTH domain
MQVRGIQVGPLLEAARHAAGMSVAQLADELGITRTTYRRIETGERNPTGIELNTIARVIETSVAPLETRVERAKVNRRIVDLQREIAWIERSVATNGNGTADQWR